jgi:S-adenosylmethionine-diacylglycerol 3-amino-3-carboxypropyl transferase
MTAIPRPAPPEPVVPIPYGGRLMFTQSWEDPACDLAALAPLQGAQIFAITSGGDNVLGFLLADPAHVLAVDLNPTQNWLLELKRAAFRRLQHGELLELLGVRPPHRAVELYLRLRAELSAPALQFWDGHQEWFTAGVLLAGGFERYFAMLRGALRYIVGRRRMERLFTLAPEEQPNFYRQQWNTLRWRVLIRIGCSRWMLGKKLDPTWFAGAGGVHSFGSHFTALAAHVIAELPARTNYFLSQILLGRYLTEDLVPDYLKPEHFETIRDRLNRLELVTADVAEALAALSPHSVDAFALSNVFEYSPAAVFDRARDEIARVGRTGARIALRNLLAPRRLSGDARFAVDVTLGKRLCQADRGFIYSHFEAARLV